VHRTREFALLFDESSGSAAPRTFGAYRVLHQIGSGVLGPVFRSYDSQRDRLIAVKAFKLDIVPEDAHRLADLLRPMSEGPTLDRTLVRLLETGVTGSTAYVAMEFATGESLDVALRHLAPSSLDRALPMLEAVAAAIDTAWAGGIGHGALHPRDIIVAPGTLDVRVTGFGIRPALESIGVVTAPRRPYSAPERTAGQDWDVRADVYSLGAIAHELLTGRRPLGSGEPEESTLLHRVLAKAMAADPDDRFATAKAFVDALDAVANSQSVAVPIASIEDAEQDETDAAAEQEAEAIELPLAKEEANVVDELPLVHAVSTVETEEIESADILDVDQPIKEETREEEDEEGIAAEENVEAEEEEAAVMAAPQGSEPVAPVVAPERVIAPPPAPAPMPAPRAAREQPLWAPFMTQPLSSEADTARRYPYPWGALAAVLLAGIALGATGMHFYTRGGQPPVVAEKPPAAPESPPARSETEVQVAPQTPPPADTSAPPPAAVAPPPPPAPETAVRAAAVTGRIVVRSQPSGALVTIDGRRMGETPVTLRDLPLGAHSVQVARRGYVPETRKVTLSSRAPAQTVSVPLRAGATSGAQTSSTPGAGARTGSIYADTNPRAARVVIDGRVYGKTPVLVPELKPGTHTVRLEMDGYTTSSTSVTVRAGEQSRVSVSLVRR
jgi:serine/threonine protein kinase